MTTFKTPFCHYWEILNKSFLQAGRKGRPRALGVINMPQFFLRVLFFCAWMASATAGIALAQELEKGEEAEISPGGEKAAEGYKPPMAGEAFRTSFLGRLIYIAPQDRANITSFSLGAAGYFPNQGNTPALPLGAFYLRRAGREGRLRLVASGFVNDIEATKRAGADQFEIVGRFENYLLPFGENGILDNREIKGSSVEWGTFSLFLGPGFRYPAAPYEFDNGLFIQLLGRLGYLYSHSTHDTDSGVRLPPDTTFYGARLRTRYDGITRNLMELPHRGWAAGFDLDLVHRNNWSDFGNNIVNYSKDDTQDYYQLAGYTLGAFGIPGLSQKNRFVAAFHFGLAEKKRTDRYNAFRFTGGPFATEADDLRRPNYPGAFFQNTRVADYALVNLEYRREIFFFLYFHVRSTFAWAERETVVDVNQIGFKSASGQSYSAALTSGFFWNSQLFLQYAWDSGYLRDGKSGSTISLLWSKAFQR